MDELFAVVGPTASGKTDLAIQLAMRVNGEIVSVDSAQIFIGLDVGTAKPPASVLACTPHHVVDIVSPDVQWSAADYVQAADTAIADIRARGKTPILCGGTGLWMRALVRGIFEAPPIDPEIREAVRGELATRGPEAMHAELSVCDPVAASRIQSRDPQRIGRALEVFRQTGIPISTFQAQHGFQDRRYRLLGVAPRRSRADLAVRIEKRVQEMYAGGIIEEVERCLGAGLRRDAPGLSIIGYRDVVAMLEGRMTREEAERATATATRRYAKRQENWFNHEPDVEWIEPTISIDALFTRLQSRERTG
ncbi:MAG: tRNA (adenosine(37)-N6)-dimethylallyltransferase MiaA [Deltaproteobacteria bacterium]|nr:tRNA (adenosine(37)-N6)-dimethylallyltransferase MiaA [Deltaproteobacteria bacterium]